MSINSVLRNFGIFSSSPKGKDYQLAIANQRELNKASSASGGYSLTETMACNSTQDSLSKDPPKGGSILRNLWQTAQNSYEFTKDLDQYLQVVRPHVEKIIIPPQVLSFAIIGGACGTVGGGVAGFGVGAIPGGGLGFLAGGLTGFIVGAVLSLGLKVAIATRVITVLGGTLHFLGSVAYQGANGALDKAYGACYAKTAIGEIKQNTGTDLSSIITSTPQRTLKDPGVRAALGNKIGKELDINNECGPFRIWLDKEPVGALIHFFKHYENQEIPAIPTGSSSGQVLNSSDSSERGQIVVNTSDSNDNHPKPTKEFPPKITENLGIKLNHHQAAEVIALMDGIEHLKKNENLVNLFKRIFQVFPQRKFEDYVCDRISKIVDSKELLEIVEAITQLGEEGVFYVEVPYCTPKVQLDFKREKGRILHTIDEKINGFDPSIKANLETNLIWFNFSEKVNKALRKG